MKKFLQFVLVGVICGIIVWLIIQFLKLSTKVEKLEEQANIEPEVQNIVIENRQEPDKLEESLLSLISSYQPIDADITAELKSAMYQIREKNDIEASKIIVRIIENVLKSDAEKNDNAWYVNLKSYGQITLHRLIKRVKEKGCFSEQDYQIAMRLKDFRNMVTHELNAAMKTDFNEVRLNLHASVMILQKLLAKS